MHEAIVKVCGKFHGQYVVNVPQLFICLFTQLFQHIRDLGIVGEDTLFIVLFSQPEIAQRGIVTADRRVHLFACVLHYFCADFSYEVEREPFALLRAFNQVKECVAQVTLGEISMSFKILKKSCFLMSIPSRRAIS